MERSNSANIGWWAVRKPVATHTLGCKKACCNTHISESIATLTPLTVYLLKYLLINSSTLIFPSRKQFTICTISIDVSD
jgi:hypothetical protein